MNALRGLTEPIPLKFRPLTDICQGRFEITRNGFLQTIPHRRRPGVTFEPKVHTLAAGPQVTTLNSKNENAKQWYIVDLIWRAWAPRRTVVPSTYVIVPRDRDWLNLDIDRLVAIPRNDAHAFFGRRLGGRTRVQITDEVPEGYFDGNVVSGIRTGPPLCTESLPKKGAQSTKKPKAAKSRRSRRIRTETVVEFFRALDKGVSVSQAANRYGISHAHAYKLRRNRVKNDKTDVDRLVTGIAAAVTPKKLEFRAAIESSDTNWRAADIEKLADPLPPSQFESFVKTLQGFLGALPRATLHFALPDGTHRWLANLDGIVARIDANGKLRIDIPLTG